MTDLGPIRVSYHPIFHCWEIATVRTFHGRHYYVQVGVQSPDAQQEAWPLFNHALRTLEWLIFNPERELYR